MSGEHRRPGAWLLPAIVVAAGAYFLYDASQRGTLRAIALSPVNWTGLALMLVGAVLAIVKKAAGPKLLGVMIAVVGAILVICL